MSLEAMLWALKGAPEVPSQCVGVLIALGERADKHGHGAYPSLKSLATAARKTERQVRYDLRDLMKLGLIREGDQSRAAALPANRRPTVYDLAMERVTTKNSTCTYCGLLADTTDHVIPRSRGGTDLPANKVPACGRCNSSKRGRTVDEWIATGRAPARISGGQWITPQALPDQQSVAPHPARQSTAPQGIPDLQEQNGGQSTAPQVSDLLGGNTASPGGQLTAANTSMNLKNSPTESSTDGHNDNTLFAAPAKPRPRRPTAPATRIDPAFAITDSMRTWAAQELPGFDIDAATKVFVDYWLGRGDAQAAKADWNATWRNWMRREAAKSPGIPGANGSPMAASDQRIAEGRALKARLAARSKEIR